MADTPDTPETTAPKTRRRAPRAVSTAPAAAPKTPRKRTPKPAEQAAETSKPTPAKRASPPKPRSTKRTTPAPKRRTATRSTAAKVTDKVGGRWATAAIFGGLAAAAGAALLTLRGSTPKPIPPVSPKDGAHQPDGADSSASFEAGIADESTIPE